MTARLILAACLSVAALGACGPDPSKGPTSSEAVKERALDAQTTRRRTGAEYQERAMTRVIRTVYLCENGERLSVDFDNPRAMATIRNSRGEAVDLYQERVADGIWYKASAYELRGKGLEATWTADGAPATTCRAVD
ncbi:hypothetical protein BH09PSE1_BH09PSE1_00930 [soil metagenome]